MATVFWFVGACTLMEIMLLAPLAPFCVHGAGREVSYVGCMQRTNGFAFKKRFDPKNETKGGMSVNRCVGICWYRRMKIAAIQTGRECYCGWGVVGLTSAPDKECRSRCTGNCYQACGGPNALSVYKTGYTREPTFVMERRAHIPAFIGCYDSRTAMDILCPSDFKPLWTRRLTIPMCIYYCDAVYQTKFSTVSATDKCCCSNSVHGTRNTVLAWCDFHGTPCDGDKKQGCIGTQEKTYQWSTHQRDRIPNFKRWPKSTFQEGKWLKPNVKAGAKFLMSDLSQPIELSAGDATLMGLLAKKKARKTTEEDTKEDEEKRPLVGADKRDPANTETKVSAGVVDVPKKSAVPEEEDESSYGAIVAVVVVGFVILLSAVAFYLYSQNKKKELEKEAEDAADETTDDEGNDDSDDDDDDDDDDNENKKLRRRKKKKKKLKKKRKKEKKRNSERRSKEDDSEENETANRYVDDTLEESEPLLDGQESDDDPRISVRSRKTWQDPS